MPDFVCPKCGHDLNAAARMALNALANVGQPFTVQVDCRECGKPYKFKLVYSIVLSSVEPDENAQRA